MRLKIAVCCAIIMSSVVSGFAEDNGRAASTFTGVISDSICTRAGSHKEAMQMSKDMGRTDAECTVACVEHEGAKYVLYNAANKKIYRLSDAARAKKFAGQQVTVTGTLKKNEIEVQYIAAR